jgi:hypothetical protein
MQWLKKIAKAWNKVHGLKGHVWGERFYARIISGIVVFLRVREYIEENPVHAGLVERRWTGYLEVYTIGFMDRQNYWNRHKAAYRHRNSYSVFMGRIEPPVAGLWVVSLP